MAAAVVLGALGELCGDRLRTASLLALLVEAELARGDLFGARRAADQLAALEESGIAVLSGEAAVARGRIAAWCGAHDEALARFQAANAALAGEELPACAGSSAWRWLRPEPLPVIATGR